MANTVKLYANITFHGRWTKKKERSLLSRAKLVARTGFIQPIKNLKLLRVDIGQRWNNGESIPAAEFIFSAELKKVASRG